jgi:hypothetical protein
VPCAFSNLSLKEFAFQQFVHHFLFFISTDGDMMSADADIITLDAVNLRS